MILQVVMATNRSTLGWIKHVANPLVSRHQSLNEPLDKEIPLEHRHFRFHIVEHWYHVLNSIFRVRGGTGWQKIISGPHQCPLINPIIRPYFLERVANFPSTPVMNVVNGIFTMKNAGILGTCLQGLPKQPAKNIGVFTRDITKEQCYPSIFRVGWYFSHVTGWSIWETPRSRIEV